MFEAGVPLFAVFEFLSREGEHALLSQTCRRVGQSLAGGLSLHAAAAQEPHLFDAKAVRMMEVGYKGGQLGKVLLQLADDEEHGWKMRQMLQSQLVYPCCIALLTMIAVMLLPPLVLTELLGQVIALTSKPPLLTQWLLAFSAFISSPYTLGALAALAGVAVLALRTSRGRALLENLELSLWFIPAVGPLWRNVVALRFLRVFAMTYTSGLPAVLGMELAASATGSQLAYRVYPLMKKSLLDGGSLSESFAAGGYLPALALESIHAGEVSGKVPMMLDNTCKILMAEVASRIDTVAKLIEPLVLACLGAFVGVFVLGCLLPIVELTQSL
jgi:type IV pilus assembly protein PilC